MPAKGELSWKVSIGKNHPSNNGNLRLVAADLAGNAQYEKDDSVAFETSPKINAAPASMWLRTDEYEPIKPGDHRRGPDRDRRRAHRTPPAPPLKQRAQAAAQLGDTSLRRGSRAAPEGFRSGSGGVPERLRRGSGAASEQASHKMELILLRMA
ncbi:hypothetical protein [Streptomyces sp. NPDC005407]|uniref:hypothetical protein n=1 Tax=Streptomyces sp. NPDC005407 TaxID=3155340 RepID=UPI0033AB9BBF